MEIYEVELRDIIVKYLGTFGLTFGPQRVPSLELPLLFIVITKYNTTGRVGYFQDEHEILLHDIYRCAILYFLTVANKYFSYFSRPNFK